MANKYHTKLRNKTSQMMFKIADAFKSRGMKPKPKPKPKFNKGGKV